MHARQRYSKGKQSISALHAVSGSGLERPMNLRIFGYLNICFINFLYKCRVEVSRWPKLNHKSLKIGSLINQNNLRWRLTWIGWYLGQFSINFAPLQIIFLDVCHIRIFQKLLFVGCTIGDAAKCYSKKWISPFALPQHSGDLSIFSRFIFKSANFCGSPVLSILLYLKRTSFYPLRISSLTPDTRVSRISICPSQLCKFISNRFPSVYARWSSKLHRECKNQQIYR